MSRLVISGLHASVRGRPILKGVDLSIASGEVHAVMGPNGTGKSTLAHVIMGKPGYEVTAGRVTLDGRDVLALEPYERAAAGLFLGMQYPTEVPGVFLDDLLAAAFAPLAADDVHARVRAEAVRLDIDPRFLKRSINVDFSGGEKKRSEMLQLAVLRPKVAILDEPDSGLDVDALRAVSRRIEEATREFGLAVMVITHYRRFLEELHADHVHILANGVVKASGGPELAAELERTGYAAWVDPEPDVAPNGAAVDPFADPFA